jgi:hypothetical protein
MKIKELAKSDPKKTREGPGTNPEKAEKAGGRG